MAKYLFGAQRNIIAYINRSIQNVLDNVQVQEFICHLLRYRCTRALEFLCGHLSKVIKIATIKNMHNNNNKIHTINK